jgi:hypothetical protein
VFYWLVLKSAQDGFALWWGDKVMTDELHKIAGLELSDVRITLAGTIYNFKITASNDIAGGWPDPVLAIDAVDQS